jgi:hypothetical protein
MNALDARSSIAGRRDSTGQAGLAHAAHQVGAHLDCAGQAARRTELPLFQAFQGKK